MAGVAVAAGVANTGGAVLRGPIEGDGRILTDGDAAGAGVAVAARALAETSGDEVGAVMGEDATDGLG